MIWWYSAAVEYGPVMINVSAKTKYPHTKKEKSKPSGNIGANADYSDLTANKQFGATAG